MILWYALSSILLTWLPTQNFCSFSKKFPSLWENKFEHQPVELLLKKLLLTFTPTTEKSQLDTSDEQSETDEEEKEQIKCKKSFGGTTSWLIP